MTRRTASSGLRIGLNLLYLRPGIVGGTETYARGLVDALDSAAPDHSFSVFLNRSAAAWPLPSRFTRVICSVSARQGRRYLYEQTRLPIQATARKLDVLHSLAYVAPVMARCASVVTVPDLNYRSPAHQMPLVRRLALSTFVNAAVRRCDAVIAISHFVANEIREAMPFATSKLHVVHLAPQERSAPPDLPRGSMQPAKPYFLAFSSTSANKNLRRLLRAHAEARSGGMSHALVVVGHRPPWPVENASEAQWTGYLPEADVQALLRDADGLLFPSLYEGFGLPILEAMQAGVAVACSARASLPEIAGDAALYFDPENVGSIADAMRTLASDPVLRADLADRGQKRAAQFNWRRTANETLTVYRMALGGRARP